MIINIVLLSLFLTFNIFLLCKNIFHNGGRRSVSQSSLKLIRSRPEVFLGKYVLKICSKFTGEHPCQSAISIKLQRNFIEITLRHVCSLVNLLRIFRAPFPKNSSEWLFVKTVLKILKIYLGGSLI